MSSVVEGGPARSWRRLFLVGAGGLAVAAATVLPAAAGGLGATAAGAAVAEPVMYVGNPGSSSILGFHLPATGDVAPAVTVSSPGDLAPSQLAFSAGGDLWSANGVQGTNKTLTAFTPAQLAAGGTATPAVTITTPGAPYGLAFDGQGDLWATEQTAHELVEYAPGQLTASGAPAPVLVISNDASTSLKDPRALAFDAGGDLWVTTTNGGPGHVVEYTPAQLAAGGAPTPAVTLTSLGDNPGGLAFDTAGDLWVTVFTGVPGPTVLGFAPAQLAASGSPVPEKKFTTHTSWGLAFDPSGNLWVVEPTTKKVDEYSSAQLAAGSPGTPAATLGGATTTLDQPFGVAVAAPPTLTSVTPDPAKPGSTVTLHGTGFTSATTVSFSGVPGTTVVDVSPFTLTAVVPPGTGSATLGVSTWAGTSNAVSFSFATPGLGYYEVASDGGLFAFTAPFKGSMGAKHLNAPMVGMTTDTATGGYWEVASDGGIFSYTAPFFGSEGGKALNAPIVGMTSLPTGKGYYEVASDGGIFAFGTAKFHGSMGAKPLNAPIVGMAYDTSTGGYYEVAKDGGLFAFTAPFKGSMGAKPLNAPVVGMAFDSTTTGYYEVASDGGLFAFTAPFKGSMGAKHLNAPVVGMVGAAG